MESSPAATCYREVPGLNARYLTYQRSIATQARVKLPLLYSNHVDNRRRQPVILLSAVNDAVVKVERLSDVTSSVKAKGEDQPTSG